MYALNLSKCQLCPFASHRQGRGGCVCTAHPEQRDFRDLAKAGECPKGKFGDAPKPMTVGDVVNGAVGVVKALGRINRASDEVIAQRKKTCGDCDRAVITAGVFRRCSVCGCALALKILTADEKCPIGRW